VQALKPDMIEAGGGSIINMSSNSFLLASGGMPAYSAAKSAVIGLTRGLAWDLDPTTSALTSSIPAGSSPSASSTCG